MYGHLDMLESRTLLSASAPGAAALAADEAALLADARAIHATLQQTGSQLVKDVRAVATDLHALPGSAANRSLLSALRRHEAAAVTGLRKDIAGIVAAAGADGRSAVAVGIQLFLNPGSATLQTRLAKILTKLQAATNAPIAGLLADLTTDNATLGADLGAIAHANPSDASLQTTTATAASHTTAALAGLKGDVQTLQADVSALAADLG